MTDKARNVVGASIFTLLGSFILFCFFMMFYSAGYFHRTPKVGDYYVPNHEQEDPFIFHNTNTILAVRQGWVLYTNQFGLRSESISSFSVCYTYVGSSPEKP